MLLPQMIHGDLDQTKATALTLQIPVAIMVSRVMLSIAGTSLCSSAGKLLQLEIDKAMCSGTKKIAEKVGRLKEAMYHGVMSNNDQLQDNLSRSVLAKAAWRLRDNQSALLVLLHL